MADDRHPVIVGVGQVTLRDQRWPDIAGPMELMLDATSLAASDTGRNVLGHVDHLTVNNIFSWDYGNAPALLAERLGLGPRVGLDYLEVGGNTVQRAVNTLGGRLAAGEIEVALVAGAEVLAGKRRARLAGHHVDWGTHPEARPPIESREPNHPSETMHGATAPTISYPLWEPALRAAAGRTPEAHSHHIGTLMARFTEVAAGNPYAWFHETRSTDDLMAVSDDNRMIALPYPKRVNAIMRVDQGAALLLTTAGKARELGVPSDRWVYLIGGGDAYDIWYLTERTTYTHSPGMRDAAEQTWKSSGLGVDDVAYFDLYSCFPSAVQLAMDAYGVAADDPRPMTVTGGLAYAGGPGNNYVTHAIATLATKLRADPGTAGLCTGLGWHVTKHSAGLYTSAPPTRPYEPIAPADPAVVDAAPHPKIESQPSGTATIEGYTVTFGRDGNPERAICLARLDAARRAMVSSDDADTAAALCAGQWYGREIEVTPDTRFRA